MPEGDWSSPDALPVPGIAPDDPPLVLIQVNEDWIPYLIGAVEKLLDPSMWNGDAETIAETLQQVNQLINQISAGYECP